MARREGPRCGPAGRPVLLTCAVATAVALLAGCSADEPDAPPATTTTVPPSTAVASTPVTASPTTSVPAFDCAAVDTAQQELDRAYADELDRLDVHRGDPRAQSVYALVTTTQGPAYYSAVLTAAPAESREDAQLVLDYYERLSAQVGDLDVDSGTEEALGDAMDRLDDATVALDPSPAGGTEVVAAQERLQAGVERSCSGPGASSSPATSSPVPSGSSDPSAGPVPSDGPTATTSTATS
ncbi:hypothetical protein [Kineococcus rubinsiae]|uniref:hypothetical protein n=1 Tax=Kineococcus rubinsiae TaxID=2609562 RepID=UPI001430F1A4|nr:hypothetical protein [Kineococcus rubinsiae]NIZ89595.1 hypothetical protein [Kineococcus rubinsiae]